ncbi:MAG: hypothetical protein Q9222_006417 [Ikaeria aurantiellina]
MDLLFVIKCLPENERATRKEIRILLLAKHGLSLSENDCSMLMSLAASTWSLTIVGGTALSLISYDEPRWWSEHEPLTKQNIHADPGDNPPSFFDHVFPPPSSMDIVKLPQSFTAANLERIGGIQIRWTDNLADHLLLRDDDTKLMLFHHVSALELINNSDRSFSLQLMSETVRTIALLIPPSLGEANPWFRREQRRHQVDARAGLCDRLNSSERQIGNFFFWRERLVLLKRTYDEAEPSSLSQLWWDDRRKTQWFTFWVAVLVFIMTVFFGVLQSVASIVQAWASVKALKAQE